MTCYCGLGTTTVFTADWVQRWCVPGTGSNDGVLMRTGSKYGVLLRTGSNDDVLLRSGSKGGVFCGLGPTMLC